MLLSILVLMSIGSIGCSKKAGLPSAANVNTVPPSTPGTGVITNANTVAFTPTSVSQLSDFAKWPLNNPTNIQIGIDLHDYGNGRYGGIMKISYNENGQNTDIRLTTGGSSEEVIHNRWFIWNGKRAFHAFFEDDKPIWADVAGGVILVIDESNDLGDGSIEPLVSGSVYYANFQPAAAYGYPPPQADKRCWFVTLGPYDCRAFLVNDTIVTTSRLYPEVRTKSASGSDVSPYKKLGTFSNLNMNAAFNY